MTTNSASLNFRLFDFWVNLPPGSGVSMGDMLDALDVDDPQSIRSTLTRLRKGVVPDPSVPGTNLRPLPVRWNPADGLYYDLSSLPSEAIAAQVPGNILSSAIGQLLVRTTTLQSSMGRDGLVRSAQLLGDADIRSLLIQVPLRDIWRVQDQIQQIGRARQLLELQNGQTADLDEDD